MTARASMTPMDRNLTADLLAKVKRKGATAADVVAVEGDSASVQVRLGAVDKLSKAQEKRLGLRVYFGNRSAGASTSDFAPAALDDLVATTCALAQAVVEDPHAGLPDVNALASLLRLVPKGADGYFLMRKGTIDCNQLDRKSAELMLIAVLASDYSPQAATHIKAARAVGATDEEMAEAVLCAVPSAGIAAWMAAGVLIEAA